MYRFTRRTQKHVATAVRQIREQQFVDDAEMADLLGNEELLSRLRAGSRDARRRTGRFVAFVQDDKR